MGQNNRILGCSGPCRLHKTILFFIDWYGSLGILIVHVGVKLREWLGWRLDLMIRPREHCRCIVLLG